MLCAHRQLSQNNLDRKLRKLSMRCYRVNNIIEVYSWLSVIYTRPSRLQRNLLFDKVCIQKQHRLNEVSLYGRLVILFRILPYQMTYKICKPTVHMECNIQHTYQSITKVKCAKTYSAIGFNIYSMNNLLDSIIKKDFIGTYI